MERWPVLHYDEWKDTLATVHLWTQIVGKIRLKLEPFINHWWNVTLMVTPRGLTTTSMPYRDGRWFSMEFDFLEPRLRIAGCDGEIGGFGLEPMAVADFYERLMGELCRLDFTVEIYAKPSEMVDATPFAEDIAHRSYDADYVRRFLHALLQADRLCKRFRASFIGKASPVQFFWCAFDLGVSRFSGRTAPPHPGGFPNMPDWATRLAYSHEEQSVGFWPGMAGMDAAFYSYSYPEPPGLGEANILPPGAWNPTLREFVLSYEDVRTAADPDSMVLDFFSTTYGAAADLLKWDRAALER
jgi:hypothetical protein